MIILVLLLILFVSCSSDGTETITSANSSCTIELNEIRLSDELPMPTRLFCVNDKLIVYQRKGDDVFLILENPEDGVLKTIGKRGRSSSEFIMVDVQSILPTDDGFLCVDQGGQLKHVYVSDSVYVQSDIISTFGIPGNGVLTKEGYVIMNVSETSDEYYLLSDQGKSPIGLSKYPNWTSDLANPPAFVYMKNMVPNPDGDLIAAFYVYFRRLRIMNTKGVILHDLIVDVPDAFQDYTSDIERTKFAYASYPCTRGQYIYALCLDSFIVGVKNQHPEIHVWTWDGKLEKRIILDRHVDIFTVTSSGRIYAMDVKSPDLLLYADLY